MTRFIIRRTNIVVSSKPSTLEYVWGMNYGDAVRRLKKAIRQAGGYSVHYRFEEVK